MVRQNYVTMSYIFTIFKITIDLRFQILPDLTGQVYLPTSVLACC